MFSFISKLTLRQDDSASQGNWELVQESIEHLDQGITVLDGDLRLVLFNRRFLELLELPDELARIGTPLADFFRFNAERGEYGPGDVEQQVRERLDLARKNESHCFERTRADGTVLEIRGNPLPGGGFITTYSDITERKRSENVLRIIAESVSGDLGEAFFHSLVESLATTLDVAYAFVGELVRESQDTVRTIAVHAHGQRAENFDYALAGTPSENVIGKTVCFHDKGVQQLFPDDHMLAEMGIESYLGTPLFDSAKQPLGILVVLDTKPLSDTRNALSLQRIVAGRAAAELERKRTLETLRESEERFRNLVTLSPEAILVHKHDVVAYANPAAAALLAATDPEQLVGTKVLDFVHPESRNHGTARMQQLWNGAESVPLTEMKLVRLDGQTVDIEVISGRTTYQGQTMHQSMFHNITERKRAEQALLKAYDELEVRIDERARELQREITEREFTQASLQRSEERFRDIAESASDWFWEQGPDLRFTFISGRFFEVSGVASEDVIGKTWMEFVDPEQLAEDPQKWRRHAEDTENRRPFRDLEYPVKNKDGQVVHIMTSGKPVFDEDETFLGYRGAGTDVTAYKLADEAIRKAHDELELRVEERTRDLQREIAEHMRDQEALRQSEERFRSVAQSANDAIIAIDAEGRVISWNQAAGRIFGYTAEEMLNRPLNDIVPQRHRKNHEAGLDRLHGKDQPRLLGKTTELHGVRKDGGEFPLELSLGSWTVGEETFYSGIIRDITKRKRAEQQLRLAKAKAEVANRAKTEFLANMSHELRTPLNSVIGFSDILADQTFGPIDSPQYREYIRDINESGKHLLALINDILDVSRIETGDLKLAERNIDVALMVASCERLIRERADKAGLDLVVELPKPLPALYADERKVKQVLLNLLSNAVKFTPEGGTVTFECGVEDDGAIRIGISDTGIGIAPENLPNVLTKFGQVESAYTRQHDGAGLGLPLSKSLVELHGGTLSVDSEIGKGTTVVIRFPRERSKPLEDRASGV